MEPFLSKPVSNLRAKGKTSSITGNSYTGIIVYIINKKMIKEFVIKKVFVFEFI